MHLSVEEIEYYLRSPEKGKVEEHLDQCESCSAIAEGLKLASTGELDQSKEKIKSLVEERIEVTAIPLFPKAIWSAAASIVVAVGLLFFARSMTSDGNSYVNEQLALYETSINVERGEIENKTLAQFVENYNSGDFDEALKSINIMAIEETSLSRQFHIAQALIRQGNPDYSSAVEIFGRVAQSQSRMANTAEWLRILSYYQMGNAEKSKNLISAMDESNIHKEQAEELLKLIGKE